MPQATVSVLHWIHDWRTFSIFIVLGVFQVLIAGQSVYLAIMALPSNLEKLSEKTKHHKHLAVTFCAVLLVSTLIVGKLNDKTQYEAATDTSKVKDELGASKTALSNIDVHVIALTGMIHTLTEPGSKLNNTARLAARKSAQGAIDEIFHQVRAGLVPASIQAFSASPVSPVPIAILPHPGPASLPSAPNTPRPSVADPIKAIQADLSRLAAQIEAIDYQHKTDDNRYRQRIYANVQSAREKTTLDKDCLLQVNSSNESRYDAYSKTLPEIQVARNKALEALNLTPSDRSKDERVFKDLNQAAADYQVEATTQPDKASLVPIAEYLDDLGKRLTSERGTRLDAK